MNVKYIFSEKKRENKKSSTDGRELDAEMGKAFDRNECDDINLTSVQYSVVIIASIIRFLRQWNGEQAYFIESNVTRMSEKLIT